MGPGTLRLWLCSEPSSVFDSVHAGTAMTRAVELAPYAMEGRGTYGRRAKLHRNSRHLMVLVILLFFSLSQVHELSPETNRKQRQNCRVLGGKGGQS